MDNYGSHRLVLAEVLKRTTKPILELGAGDFSTPLIHIETKSKKIVTIDDSKMWLSKFWRLETDWHKLMVLDEEETMEFYKKDNVKWGLVFIDNSTWELRFAAIMKYKDIADYIILHDCNYYPDNNIFGTTIEKINVKFRRKGIRDYSDVFKYWIEFFMHGHRMESPPTLLGSNKICLDDIAVDKMEIANRNK